MKNIVVIGGGASGLVAAIYAKTENNQVTILEKNQFCGKKLLTTGNGKCNYWNKDQSLNHYHSNNHNLLSEVITEENIKAVNDLFSSLGIYPKIKNGYYYPFSNQATTVKEHLLEKAQHKGVIIRNNFDVENIQKINNYFEILGNDETIYADQIVIATGSRAAPKTGSTGFGYELLKKFGHTIIEPLPALVQLKTKGNYLKSWAGIRTDVNLSLYENDNLIAREQGEIQLTDYGISGICVFNLSGRVARGLKNNKKEYMRINFLPFIESNPNEFLTAFLPSNLSLKSQLAGILNNKLVDVILKEANINTNTSYRNLTYHEQKKLLDCLTSFQVEITSTNSFNEAQVSSGGIPLTEINIKTMESKLVSGLYIVGELLDVDGDCGGYNLGFAWISGLTAGQSIGGNTNA